MEGTNSLFPKITSLKRYQPETKEENDLIIFIASKELHKLAADFFCVLYKELS